MALPNRYTDSMLPDFSFSSPRIDQVGVEERASRFTKRSIKKEAKLNGLKLVLNMIDLTTLEGKDTDGKVKQLCYKAMHPHDAYPGYCQLLQLFVFILPWLKWQKKHWVIQE